MSVWMWWVVVGALLLGPLLLGAIWRRVTGRPKARRRQDALAVRRDGISDVNVEIARGAAHTTGFDLSGF